MFGSLPPQRPVLGSQSLLWVPSYHLSYVMFKETKILVDIRWWLRNRWTLYVCPYSISLTITPNSSLPRYDGASVVARSIDLKQPVVLVSMNYR